MSADQDLSKNMPPNYKPAAVWSPPVGADGQAFGGMNRPTAGARSEKELPVGKYDLQLYSMATPNGVKVTIMLEELLAAGYTDAEYDAWPIKIMQLDQFTTGFVELNPNSKIPAMKDVKNDVVTFESASIVLYLSERFGNAFVPKGLKGRANCINWVMWCQGAAPYLGGGFGHFYNYAPIKIEYAIDRYSMETKRMLDVLDKHLAKNTYLAGEEYSIADMCTYPWFGSLVQGKVYGAAEYLQVATYTNVVRWSNLIQERPAVKIATKVNKFWGPEEEQMPERH